jgi:hypothetical protein
VNESIGTSIRDRTAFSQHTAIMYGITTTESKSLLPLPVPGGGAIKCMVNLGRRTGWRFSFLGCSFITKQERETVSYVVVTGAFDDGDLKSPPPPTILHDTSENAW